MGTVIEHRKVAYPLRNPLCSNNAMGKYVHDSINNQNDTHSMPFTASSFEQLPISTTTIEVHDVPNSCSNSDFLRSYPSAIPGITAITFRSNHVDFSYQVRNDFILLYLRNNYDAVNNEITSTREVRVNHLRHIVCQ